QECQQKGITIKPPCVNHSFSGFRVEPDANSASANGESKLAIRYALGAIKNVGAEAMARLTEERDAGAKFENMMDFLERLPRDASNRRQMENLVRAGALDCLHDNRQELLQNIDYLLAHAETLRRDKESNQNNLFGDDTDSMASALRLTPCDDWVVMDRLKEEFDAL
ncbi:MAG: DNA polymerase III subunit alpha, partial [Candidatus Puniceispirillaceae bacterium]